MKWYFFDNVAINLDNVITIDRIDNKLEIFVVGNSKLISKNIIFETRTDCINAFERLNEWLKES